jgi:hypothetical protein
LKSPYLAISQTIRLDVTANTFVARAETLIQVNTEIEPLVCSGSNILGEKSCIGVVIHYVNDD